jgi:hypothetical protein
MEVRGPLPIYPQEKDPGACCVRGWVEPSAGLDALEKRKISYPLVCHCTGCTFPEMFFLCQRNQHFSTDVSRIPPQKTMQQKTR